MMWTGGKSGLERSTKDLRLEKFMIHAKDKNNTVVAKAQIRVIKKDGIGNVEMPAVVNKLPAKEVARQITATIMNWISDLESRKIEETRLATERFQHT